MADDRNSRQAYFAEAQTWAHDRRDGLRASRRTAWVVACVAISLAFLEALALIALTPLKTVVPLTLLVDRHTGYVEELKDLKPGEISADKALTQSFLVQYVIAREGFDMPKLREDYRKVALWSAQDARGDYLKLMGAANPQNPLNRYPRSTLIETRVKSVTPMSANSALVRFDTQRRDEGAQTGPVQNWVAVIQFRFSGEPLKQEDRFINPLGFQVLHYQRSAETLDTSVIVDMPIAPSSGIVPSGSEADH